MFTTQDTALASRLAAVMGTAHLVTMATDPSIAYGKREATLTHALKAATQDGDSERVKCITNAMQTLRSIGAPSAN